MERKDPKLHRSSPSSSLPPFVSSVANEDSLLRRPVGVDSVLRRPHRPNGSKRRCWLVDVGVGAARGGICSGGRRLGGGSSFDPQSQRQRQWRRNRHRILPFVAVQTVRRQAALLAGWGGGWSSSWWDLMWGERQGGTTPHRRQQQWALYGSR